MSLRVAMVGLSLSSSWGNGHATTYRALIKGLHALGHEVQFLERDVPWYAQHRDLTASPHCGLHFYDDLAGLEGLLDGLGDFDAIVVGSFVPQGIEVIDMLAARASGRLSFYDIDTPVTLSRLEDGSLDYLEKRQIPLFATYFSFAGGEALRRLARLGARNPVELFCSVDPDLYRPTGEAIRWDLGYLGTYSDDRQPTLERLLIAPARRLPKMRFVVAGPQYPDTIDWPDNVERIDHLPPSRHASFYSQQRFTLNVTRAQMVSLGSSPSVRLFEAASCGTPIFSDRWEGLSAMLPEGEALLVAEDAEDVISILETTGAAARNAIADRARRIVHQGHTGMARAREFVAGLDVMHASRPWRHGPDQPGSTSSSRTSARAPTP